MDVTIILKYNLASLSVESHQNLLYSMVRVVVGIAIYDIYLSISLLFICWTNENTHNIFDYAEQFLRPIAGFYLRKIIR